MRAVIQRVLGAKALVNGTQARSIGPGLLILLGVKETDGVQSCAKLAKKCAGLRIFEDAEGKMNFSALQLGYSAMVISNFTLYADTKKGKRPSFSQAAGPELGEACYAEFVRQISGMGLREVQTGEFGADMKIELTNDGPVTIVIDTDEWEKT